MTVLPRDKWPYRCDTSGRKVRHSGRHRVRASGGAQAGAPEPVLDDDLPIILLAADEDTPAEREAFTGPAHLDQVIAAAEAGFTSPGPMEVRAVEPLNGITNEPQTPSPVAPVQRPHVPPSVQAKNTQPARSPRRHVGSLLFKLLKSRSADSLEAGQGDQQDNAAGPELPANRQRGGLELDDVSLVDASQGAEDTQARINRLRAELQNAGQITNAGQVDEPLLPASAMQPGPDSRAPYEASQSELLEQTGPDGGFVSEPSQLEAETSQFEGPEEARTDLEQTDAPLDAHSVESLMETPAALRSLELSQPQALELSGSDDLQFTPVPAEGVTLAEAASPDGGDTIPVAGAPAPEEPQPITQIAQSAPRDSALAADDTLLEEALDLPDEEKIPVKEKTVRTKRELKDLSRTLRQFFSARKKGAVQAALAILDGLSLFRRALMPVTALYTAAIADTSLRVVVTRGSRVLRWAEVKLPEGVVRDGVVADQAAFAARLARAISAVRKDAKLKGERLSVAISGRNAVQRRFPVFETESTDLEKAILEACAERMAIKPDELQLDWDIRLAQGPAEAAAEAQKAQEGVIRHEVYAFGIYKHVVDTDLRALAPTGARFDGAQPKALALAAAVNSQSGVIVDTEASSLTVIVLRDGVPEVVREVGIDAGMSKEQWVSAVSTHVARTVAYYNSLYSQDQLKDDAPLFLTGSGRTSGGSAVEAVSQLPYRRAALGRTLRAPKDFSFAKYAANIGLALLAGKRFWLRTPVALVPRPRLEFLPIEFQPKPLPVRAILTAAMSIALLAGLGAAYQMTAMASSRVEAKRQHISSLERQVKARVTEISKTKAAETQAEALKAEAQTINAASQQIRNLDRHFALTLATFSGLVPQGVFLNEVDDDGGLVSISASGDSYDALLSYVRLIEAQGEFRLVIIKSIGTQVQPESAVPGAPAGPGAEADPSTGGAYTLQLDVFRDEPSVKPPPSGAGTGSAAARP